MSSTKGVQGVALFSVLFLLLTPVAQAGGMVGLLDAALTGGGAASIEMALVGAADVTEITCSNGSVTIAGWTQTSPTSVVVYVVNASRASQAFTLQAWSDAAPGNEDR